MFSERTIRIYSREQDKVENNNDDDGENKDDDRGGDEDDEVTSSKTAMTVTTNVQFGCKMKNLIRKQDDNDEESDDNDGVAVGGVQVVITDRSSSSSKQTKTATTTTESGSASTTTTTTTTTSEDVILPSDIVVLATGHSARDVYESLYKGGIVKLESKGFAVGFRIEHPQSIITKIQYGKEWGKNVITGKKITDTINANYFAKFGNRSGERDDDDDGSKGQQQHTGRLPVPSYRLAMDRAWDGTTITTNMLDDNDTKMDNTNDSSKNYRGVYSFCMCPGGQIVPSSTNETELCINGMSFSKRDSQWANSALVVTINPNDDVLKMYYGNHDENNLENNENVLAGVDFQRDIECKAAIMGGGNWTVPVQRVVDFLQERVTPNDRVPSSSYRLGVRSAPLHEIYPKPITYAIQQALVYFNSTKMPGYVCDEALLHGVETRTSSPVRISRGGGEGTTKGTASSSLSSSSSKYLATGTTNVYPVGEGAGFAGGIVSAAVDGMNVADAIWESMIQ